MKTMFKNMLIAVIACGLLFAAASCSKHTCPTYSKVEKIERGNKA